MISWNVRGLGSPRAIRRLRFLLKQYNLQMVFFMETKVSATWMEKIRRRCGYTNGFNVEADGSRDHCPLLISLDLENKPVHRSSFRFEAWWLLEDSFEKMILESWQNLTGLLTDKLEGLKVRILQWANQIKNARKGIK
ncbi:hypothetical protein PVK06_034125 [Gossypium arboreum]|uniref:Reverse transcriptase n=1 Tax=Gossypium arboreum TaxID=29729 RepID=A0ABR0NFG8_GOSAR|nr:hypothetical protein PVK06_034125 [Gossypium arboreum]